VSRNNVEPAPLEIAQASRFHPVRDYLSGLEWDGRARLRRFAEDYLGADPGNDEQRKLYLRAISKSWLVSAVARVMEPGCKVDTTVILEAPQGVRKSTLIRAIAVRDDWFADTEIDFSSKDSMQALQGVWFIELGELDTFSRREVNTVKMFLTKMTDRFRVPYGSFQQDFPRQCIFVGTTNENEYLRDATGARRFWPITCGMVKIDKVRTDIDQLWAEARVLYEQGEQWWLTPAEERYAGREQDTRYDHDVWTHLVLGIASALAGSAGDEPISVDQILERMEIPIQHRDNHQKARVNKILKKAGFVLRRPASEGSTDRPRLWYAPTGFEHGAEMVMSSFRGPSSEGRRLPL
jgi:putative DNA primase/helicase